MGVQVCISRLVPAVCACQVSGVRPDGVIHSEEVCGVRGRALAISGNLFFLPN